MKKRIGMLLVLLCLLLGLRIPVSAAESGYIHEIAPLFQSATAAEMEQLCAEAAELYGCGIYTVILDDFSVYHSDAYEAAKIIYKKNNFGVGENKNGIMLLLSMSERDYALICYGDIANSVFTDRMQEDITEFFLDDLSENDWDDGLKDYVSSCVYALEHFEGTVGEGFPGYYKDGVYYPPVDLTWMQTLQSYALLILIVSLLFAKVAYPFIRHWLVATMYTAREATNADEYIVPDSVRMRVKEDVYSHTEERTVYESSVFDSDDSGDSDWDTTVDSDGFSGRSGKF